MPVIQPIGYVSFVLHAHLPYLRQAGRWPHGEEALHEVISEAYLPLLTLLSDFSSARMPIRITLAASPILLEQLADLVVQKHAILAMEAALQRAEDDVVRWEEQREAHMAYLARFYADWYERALNNFSARFGRNLASALRALVDQGVVEPFTGMATHCYLPRIEEPSLVRTQLKLGAAMTTWHLGEPSGLWLPELCYREGLGQHLVEAGLRTIVLDGQQAEDGLPPQPAWIDSQRSAVALFRDRRSVMPVLSSGSGYPGDFLYREFHRYDPTSGLHFWRVTGAGVPLSEKAMYDPYHALARAQEHAFHYVSLIERRLRAYYEAHGRPGLLVVAFDAELFGHGWFEGSTWLRLVLQQLAAHPAIEMTTSASYLERCPPETIVEAEQDSCSWDCPQLDAHWAQLNAAARRMHQLTCAYIDAADDRERCLNQAARELLLASASDWAALLATGRAPAFARQRFDAHLERFERLAMLAQEQQLDRQQQLLLAELEELDNPFPLLNFRIFDAGE